MSRNCLWIARTSAISAIVGLLRAHRERPRRRRAADKSDELAAPHSITSSASC
jgi:hypothetical protein